MPDSTASLTVETIVANLKAFMDAASKLHREDYPTNRDYYYGGKQALRHISKHRREEDAEWVQRRARLIGVNVCGVIVDKLVSAQYGTAATRSFDNDALADEFAEAVPADVLHRSRIDTARQRAIDGVAILHLYWDAEAERVAWKHELPEHFFPIVMGDYDRIDAVIIDRSGRAGSGGRIRYFADDTYPDKAQGQYNPAAGDRPADTTTTQLEGTRIIEVYTPTESAVVKVTIGSKGAIDRAKVVEQEAGVEQIEFGCLPFMLWNGKRLVGDLFGSSAIHGVTEINAAVNRELSNLDQIIDVQTFSLLVIQGSIPNLPTDAKGFPRLDVGTDSFLMLDEQGKVYYADPNPKISETLEVINALVELAMSAGRVPMVVVQPQQAHAESGISRQIQFLPLIDLITELETLDLRSEREFAARALLIQRRMSGQAEMTLAAVEEAMAGFKVDWSENFYPTDEATRLEVYQMRRDLDLESRRQQVKRENPDLDDEAIDLLIEEIDAEKDAEAERSTFDMAPAEE